MTATSRQRGIATLLTILLLGLAVTVTVLAVTYSLRGTQQRQLATHSVTAAQGSAWRGVEALRLLLLQLPASQYALWASDAGGGTRGNFGSVIPVSGDASASSGGSSAESGGGGESAAAGAAAACWSYPGIAVDGMQRLGVSSATVTRACTPNAGGGYQVTAQVAGNAGSGSAASSSTVEVVYQVVPSSGAAGCSGSECDGSSAPNTAVVTFNHDLNLSGSITVLKDGDTNYTVNVKGDVSTGGNSITGVDVINATGGIRISSGSSFGTLNANGDVLFDGSVGVRDQINTRGNVCIEGGASAANALVRANGSVVGTGGAMLGDIYAIGQSSGSATALCTGIAVDAAGNPYAVDLQGNSGARLVRAKGSVRIASGSISTQPDGLLAEGNLVDVNWGGSEYGQVGGAVEGGNPATTTWVRHVDGLTVPISPVSPVVLEEDRFNAYEVKPEANYAFKTDGAGYIVVTVRSVNGIDSGDYFLADYANNEQTGNSRGYKDFLCKQLDPASTPAAPLCAAPVRDPPGTLCMGYSTYNDCIGYDAGTSTWNIQGTTLAPGVVWFEGNLNIGNGTFYNTLIATRSITMGGSITVYAVNYAGYDGTRMLDGTATRYAPTGICVNSNFPDRYPTDRCDMSARALVNPEDSVLGNYALLAGSYLPDGDGSTYAGGDIGLGTSANIYGSVLAGNAYNSGGSTTIHGFVTALSQGDATHAAGGSTTFDLRGLPSGYVPGIQPCEMSGTCAGEPEEHHDATATVRWSRYR